MTVLRWIEGHSIREVNDEKIRLVAVFCLTACFADV